MKTLLLLNLASFICLNSAGRHRGGGAFSAHTPPIKGGIGDGYIYPINHKPQSAVRTYKLVLEQPSYSGGRGAFVHTQPQQVKIFKILRMPAGYNTYHHSDLGAGKNVETIKIIHVDGKTHGSAEGNVHGMVAADSSAYQADFPVITGNPWN